MSKPLLYTEEECPKPNMVYETVDGLIDLDTQVVGGVPVLSNAHDAKVVKLYTSYLVFRSQKFPDAEVLETRLFKTLESQ
ncbi:hypothetical protein J6590_001135 [Homalodisca vitripennis]|nr:hypothetical protein J6590_001135 [Homalodisca vitripennis]